MGGVASVSQDVDYDPIWVLEAEDSVIRVVVEIENHPYDLIPVLGPANPVYEAVADGNRGIEPWREPRVEQVNIYPGPYAHIDVLGEGSSLVCNARVCVHHYPCVIGVGEISNRHHLREGWGWLGQLPGRGR